MGKILVLNFNRFQGKNLRSRQSAREMKLGLEIEFDVEQKNKNEKKRKKEREKKGIKKGGKRLNAKYTSKPPRTEISKNRYRDEMVKNSRLSLQCNEYFVRTAGPGGPLCCDQIEARLCTCVGG